jgi:protein-S-isoprenylcysteine O-methyltransferase Ste14
VKVNVLARTNGQHDRKSVRKIIMIGLLVAVVFVMIGAFILSYSMETLDKQADKLGAQEKPIWNAPFADYNIPGLENGWGTLIVGVGGVSLLFVVTLVVANLLKKKQSQLLK